MVKLKGKGLALFPDASIRKVYVFQLLLYWRYGDFSPQSATSAERLTL